MIIGEIKRNDRFGTEFNPVPDRLDRHSRDVQDRGFGRTELWEQLDKDLVAISKFEKEGESMDQFAENMILMKRYSYPDDVVGGDIPLISNGGVRPIMASTTARAATGEPVNPIQGKKLK